jgi:tetratricopeptide (TPR) repeat protein
VGTMKALLPAFALVLALCGSASADGYQDFQAGLTSRNREEWDDTIKSLTLALNSPDLPQYLRAIAHFDRAVAYLEEKQIDPAVSDLTATIAEKPNYALAYSTRASAYVGQLQYAKALDDISKAISLRPTYQLAYVQRITIRVIMKDRDGAIADSTELVNRNPDNPAVYHLRATEYRVFGSYDLAIADENTALSLGQRLPDDYRERGFAYLMKGDYEKAVADFDMETRYSQDPTLAFLHKGTAQWDLAKFDDAGASFVEALKRQPSQNYAFLWLMLARARTGGAVDTDTTARFASADLSKWPGPLVALYLGKATLADVTAAVQKQVTASDKLNKCSTDFFLAEWPTLQKNSAATQLQKVVADCPDDTIYKPAAVADLGRGQAK